MTVINTNVSSLNAQAALASNARGLTKAMQQLSTGKRISSAADDAAGLAISTRLTSQIKGLNQAVRNGNDAISLVQIAEGASVEITNMMQRMRELAVQSANDTNTDGDREYLDLEFQQLKTEINRIGSTVQWNGVNVLDGSFSDGTGTFQFQVGANANQVISLTIGDFRSYESTVAVSVDSTDLAAPQFDITDLNTQFDATDDQALVGTTITMGVSGRQVQYMITSDDIDDIADTAAPDLAEIVATKLTDLMQAELDEAFEEGDYTVTDNGDGTIGVTGPASDTESNGAVVATIKVAAGDLSGIHNESIDTQGNSNSAIIAIDSALDVVNAERAKMGATINRLQYAVDNLTNVSTRSSEARSRIEDTDYAQATMELAKRQIIQQAATAMLAQANQQPQQVLTLLK